MLEAWRELPDVALRIAGTGPMAQQVRDFAASHSNVEYVGMITPAEVAELMRGAIATLLPSTWDEPSPVVVAQSFSVGTPVIASDFGSRHETVVHGKTGLVYPGADVKELVRQVRWAANRQPQVLSMVTAARREYELKFSSMANHKRLMAAYEETLERKGRREVAALV